jgi:peptide/nickel transport system substrate-binding protein
VSDSSNDIKLTAFNNYWGGHVYTRQVDFLGYQAGSDIPSSLLTSKQLQVISVPLDPAFVTKLKSDGYVISSSPSYAVGQLVFDTRATGTPLANVAVRRALAEGTNKEALITASGHTGSPPTNQIIAQGIPGYDPSIPTVPFSPAKAKAALAAAGYPNGFSFNFAYYAEAATTALATEFQKEMAAIGVTVDLEPQTDINAYGNIVQNGGADMYYDLLSSDYVDGSDILSFFVDSPYYSSPAMDALNTQASQTLDATKRVQLLQQMNALVSSDQANIPLYQQQSQVLAVAPHIVIQHDTDGVVQVDSYFYHDYQN